LVRTGKAEVCRQRALCGGCRKRALCGVCKSAESSVHAAGINHAAGTLVRTGKAESGSRSRPTGLRKSRRLVSGRNVSGTSRPSCGGTHCQWRACGVPAPRKSGVDTSPWTSMVSRDGALVAACRGTSPMRKCTPLGPYRRSRVFLGGWRFLVVEVPL